MPNRVIRESLLDSQRYWNAPIEARQLFIHLMLVADDLGCVQLSTTYVRRHCFDDQPSDDKINTLLGVLSDLDLIRIYMHDGARYGFIPRFRQRIQLRHLKYPPPPQELLAGDEDAQEKLRKFNDKGSSSTVEQPLSNGESPQFTVGQRCEAEAKAKSKKVPSPGGEGAVDGLDRPALSDSDCPHDRIIKAYHETLPTLPRIRVWTNARRSRLRSRWRDMRAAGKYGGVDDGLHWWRGFFAYVGKSSFLTGNVPGREGRTPFQADLDWLVHPDNFAKVIEGRYDDATA